MRCIEVKAFSIAQKNIHCVHMEDTIAQTQDFLASKNITCAPVVDSAGRCFGVISAEHLLHFHKDKNNPAAVKAWEICTHKFHEIGVEHELEDAIKILLENSIHHLIVIEKGIIAGIISSIDIIKALHQGHSGLQLNDELIRNLKVLMPN